MSNVFYLPMEAHRKLVLLTLADNASDNGRCWPSQETIALRASLTARRCRDHLHALDADGWLSVLSAGSGRGNTSQYLLNVDAIADAALKVRETIKAEKADGQKQKADILAEKAVTSVPLNHQGIIKEEESNISRPESLLEVPREFLPLVSLKGYTARNHTRAFQNISAACLEARVDVEAVVRQFAADYPVLRHQYGWSDPVATLGRGKPLSIAISKVLNGDSYAARVQKPGRDTSRDAGQYPELDFPDDSEREWPEVIGIYDDHGNLVPVVPGQKIPPYRVPDVKRPYG